MLDPSPQLFRHESRPDWGLATIAWERDGKRAYLFETGMVRVLAEPFYRFMLPVEAPREDQLAMLERLMVQVGVRDAQVVAPRASLPPSVHFEIADQLAAFSEEAPGGFGEAWKKAVRGEGVARRLKRHRNPAIAHMQSAINVQSLEAALTSDNVIGVWLTICEVLEGTDLVAAGPLAQLKKSSKRATPASVTALGEVLFGGGDFSDRFDRYVAALRRLLGRAPSWELCTAILALSDPKTHVCVRRSSFQQQADWIMPELRGSAHPNSLTYGGFMRLSKAVCQQLELSGLAPEDYLDIYDFIKATTAPRAVQRMASQRQGKAPVSTPRPSDPARAA
jgi:hypothetical protein